VPAAKREGGRWVFELGTSRARLAAALTEIARETRAALRAFSSLSVLEIARRTGLPLRRAARLQKRDYEESFLLDEKLALARVRTAAAERGLRVVRSGRFHRLVGSSDTGRAVRVLVGMFAAKREQPETIGLGDTPGDLPMLQAVSRPILIPRRDGRVHPVLAAALPHAEAAPAPGPEGWNRAVLEVLAGRRLSAPAA
jgi:mannosyl-3-phosphoglycerate phosphatase family protein